MGFCQGEERAGASQKLDLDLVLVLLLQLVTLRGHLAHLEQQFVSLVE